MWVIKCGGSLAGSQSLAACLRVLVEHGTGRVVIVPGGGPFADSVRDLQRNLRYRDSAAHQMALLAMDQYAWYLSDLEPRLQICHRIDAARDVLGAGEVALLAIANELGKAPIPATWRVTSDSLAAYVARRLGAQDLLLLKSMALDEPYVSAQTLAADGRLDAEFPLFIQHAPYRVWWSGPNPNSLAGILRDSNSAPSAATYIEYRSSIHP